MKQRGGGAEIEGEMKEQETKPTYSGVCVCVFVFLVSATCVRAFICIYMFCNPVLYLHLKGTCLYFDMNRSVIFKR